MNTLILYSSAIPMVKLCVKKHISSCEKCQKDTVKKMLRNVMNRMSRSCPEVNCDRCGAQRCMDHFTHMMKVNDPDICRYRINMYQYSLVKHSSL